MRYVVLPQALKNMIPSLASIIGFMDLTKAAQVVNAREVRPFALYLFIAVVYWICTCSMPRYTRHVEARLTPCLRSGARMAAPPPQGVAIRRH